MPAIILPDRWTRQPQYPAPLDKSGRLFNPANISACVLPSVSPDIDLHTGRVYTTAGVNIGASSIGKTVQWTGNATTEYIDLCAAADMDRLLALSTATIILIVQRTASTGVTGMSYGYDVSGTNRAGIYMPYTDNTLYWDYGADTTGRATISMAPYAAAGTINQWAFVAGSRGREIWRNGQRVASATSMTGSRSTSSLRNFRLGCAGSASTPRAPYETMALALISRDQMSEGALAEITANPWGSLFSKSARIYFFPSAGGGGATGTGAPAAQSSTVSGTATRTITGTGTPSAQASTVAGTAEREITGSGAPVSQDATVAGTGSVSAGISGSGVLSAQSATVAGTATRTVTASGTPSAQGATVAGTAEREVTGSGTSSAQSATVVGTGQIGNIVTGSGAPAAQSATVAGTAEREITSSGAVSAQSATVAGAGVRVITGTGSPNAQNATVYGYDVAPQTAHNTGGGGSRKMLLSERKVRDEVDEWLKKKREQEMLARIQREDEELVLILALVA